MTSPRYHVVHTVACCGHTKHILTSVHSRSRGVWHCRQGSFQPFVTSRWPPPAPFCWRSSRRSPWPVVLLPHRSSWWHRTLWPRYQFSSTLRELPFYRILASTFVDSNRSQSSCCSSTCCCSLPLSVPLHLKSVYLFPAVLSHQLTSKMPTHCTQPRTPFADTCRMGVLDSRAAPPTA